MDKTTLTFDKMMQIINDAEFAQITGDYFDENHVEHQLCQHIHLHRKYYIKFKSLDDLRNGLSYMLLGESGIKFSGLVKIQMINNVGAKYFIAVGLTAHRIYDILPGWTFDGIANELKDDYDYALQFKDHPLLPKDSLKWWIAHWKRQLEDTEPDDTESQTLLQTWICNIENIL